ncbi:MAG: cation:proton antiporter, partial [Pararhodobacter sp.]|nr:cation:proton antiporter [Pararhodobacter sp.]
ALLSQISIAVLLFLVGLKMDIGLIRSLGAVAVIAGIGQMAFTIGLGFGLGLLLGLTPLVALYVALGLAFSSTIIVVKMLSDKREIDSLHGRIALGILIVQDIAVVLAMVVVAAIGAGNGHSDAAQAAGQADGSLWLLVLGAVSILAVVWVFVRWLAAPLLGLIARSPELVVIFAVGWAAGFAALADAAGLGKELGGLAAGVSLASTPFRDAIGARLAPLRDFLLLFFFLSLGAGLDLNGLGAQLGPALVLSGFVLIGKPVIVTTIMGVLGYRARTGFLAGITLGQISEFSLIFLAMGVSLGHVGPETGALVTLVALITIAVSVYGIGYAHRLHSLAEPVLRWFERPNPVSAEREDSPDSPDTPGAGHDFVILGLGRYGCRIGQGLKARGFTILGVDFDPEALRNWREMGLDAQFGDATDPEFVAHLPLRGVRAVISAVPPGRGALSDADRHPAFLHALRAVGFAGEIVVTVNHRNEGAPFNALGATLILAPFEDAAESAAQKIADCCRC